MRGCRVNSVIRVSDPYGSPAEGKSPPETSSAANPKGDPSLSLQMAHRAPGWMTSPPDAVTLSRAEGRSATRKYGNENRSPGPTFVEADPRTADMRLPTPTLSGGPHLQAEPQDGRPELPGP